MFVELSHTLKPSRTDHLFILVPQSNERDLPQAVAAISAEIEQRSGFEGRSDETITVLHGHPRKVTLVGLGKEISIRCLRSALTVAAKIAQKQRDRRIAVAVAAPLPDMTAAASVSLTASFLAHADYKYETFKSRKKEDAPIAVEATLLAPASIGTKQLRALEKEAACISDAVRTVRDLGNAPCNLITPSRLAERAEEVAKSVGVKCTVLGRREIVKLKMGGLLAVNRGSVEEPRFIIMEYVPRRAKKHVALVGKGITFDSGGISIKPAEKMEEMKFDMCGAAAVIGVIEAAAGLELPVKITALVPSTDNLPSGSAYKPGEIITMMNGKTVEIVNTDAEGRMILGDALHYASKLKPDHIIDFATLTGACVVALASEAAGLFSNDEELARKLIEGGERVGERLWRMPVWEEYKDLIRSEWADLKNSGGRWGGAITAAVFLKEFVDCPSWAHLDIAGTAYAEHDTGRDPKGATGAGVRVTLEFLRSLSQS